MGPQNLTITAFVGRVSGRQAARVLGAGARQPQAASETTVVVREKDILLAAPGCHGVVQDCAPNGHGEAQVRLNLRRMAEEASVVLHDHWRATVVVVRVSDDTFNLHVTASTLPYMNELDYLWGGITLPELYQMVEDAEDDDELADQVNSAFLDAGFIIDRVVETALAADARSSLRYLQRQEQQRLEREDARNAAS